MDATTIPGTGGPTGGGAGIDLDAVVRFVDIAVEALASAREEIDALNVYPVPDGDTGTNMYLTVVAARDAIREARERSETSRDAVLGALILTAVAVDFLLGKRIGRITSRARGRPTAGVPDA